ncbi:MAG: hypothetical protein HFH14_06730 [Lachnospiraceae bacterium]|nr:hypothetical protein [Lachnospiraceae bacterium]
MRRFKINLLYLILLLPIWGVMLLQLVVRVKAIKENYAEYSILFTLIMLALIFMFYFIPYKCRARRRLSFNYILITLWSAMCLLMLYSDIVVSKKYCYLSLTLLILFTGLFAVLQQYGSKERGKLFEIFLLAIETGFIGASLVCFLFRPYTSGIRYSGLSANPNVYGIFLITVWACLLTKLDYCIGRSKDIKKCIIIGAELGTATMFLYLTAARTSFLTIAFISIVWFIFRAVYTRRKNNPLLKYILSTAAAVAASFAVSYLLLATVPNLINKPIVFERDRLFTAEYSTPGVCYASSQDDTANTPDASASDKDTADRDVIKDIEKDVEQAVKDVADEPSPISRLLSVFGEGATLDIILNGRISIYKEYLKHIDFKGHEKYGRKVNGTYVVNAHNNALQIAYSYGLGASIAYILLCIFTLIYSLHYYIRYHDKRKTAAFPMLIVISFIISSLTECILLPMQSLLAFCFFVCLGELMITYAPGRKA